MPILAMSASSRKPSRRAENRQLGIDHRRIQHSGPQRIVNVADAAHLQHSKIALALDRPLLFDVTQAEIGGRTEARDADLFAFEILDRRISGRAMTAKVITFIELAMTARSPPARLELITAPPVNTPMGTSPDCTTCAARPPPAT